MTNAMRESKKYKREDLRMKAAVCYDFTKPLVVEEVTLDPPKKGEVKVKLAATAICHSDIHVIKGELFGKPPVIAGHESAGYVDSVGEGVTGLKVGDPVVLSLVASCGHCHYCTIGLPHLCDHQFPLQTESRLHTMKGENIGHIFKTATFAEYAIVDQSQLVKIPGDMPMAQASLLACGVITGFGAVVSRLHTKAMSSAVVIGVGGVGLNSIQGAAFSGAYPVIAIDVNDAKLEAAKKFGATHVINSGKTDPVEAVKKLTGGLGAEYVFVTVGRSSVIVQSVMMTRKRGTVVLIGLPSPKDPFTLSAFDIIGPERVITGGFMGSTNLQADIPLLVELYKAGKLKLDELITKRYPLEKINEAIDAVIKGDALRNVIEFK
jgi:S-(hydroxymethyl)glutathione dehydrogenase / alcohol dehydrogenase